jgi:hypothetical protein
MKIVISSILRGFGLTLGRKAADSIIDNLKDSTEVYKKSPSLTGAQIFKTILWLFPMMLIAGLITGLLLESNIISGYNQGGPCFGILTILFTFIIAKGYYNENKYLITQSDNYNKIKKEKERLIKETEEQYISEKITKREYEILMKRINKM